MDKKQLLIGLRGILTRYRLKLKTDTGHTYTYLRDIPGANEYLEKLIDIGDYIDYSYREGYIDGCMQGNMGYINVYLIHIDKVLCHGYTEETLVAVDVLNELSKLLPAWNK
jgi:hypothetical protein